MATVVRSPVSPQALDAALGEFHGVLGDARVITDADGLRAFRDPFQFATWEDNTASAVLSPRQSRRSRRSCGSPTATVCPCGRTAKDATTATADPRRGSRTR